MTPLNEQQKQLLFDYSLGLASEEDCIEAERLVASHPEASRIHEAIRTAVSPLDCIEPEYCPDDLAEQTVMRLKEAVASEQGQRQLEDMLVAEQTGRSVVKMPSWRNWSDVLAAAAVIALFVSILFPSLGFVRQRYWQYQCRNQLAGIYDGLAAYVSDHNGQLPMLATAPGAPWWKVGYQGQENHSNTRRAWLLVRYGYVQPEQFICAGRPDGRGVSFATFNAQEYSDFPSRVYIQYSLRVGCPSSDSAGLDPEMVIFADVNPLSERLPSDFSTPFRIQMCDELMTYNSSSHGRRGQNALFGDGAVEFLPTRHSRSSDDDIYTLTEMTTGCEVTGVERPSCDTDAFLVP
jgi:hypothetical protein